MIRFFLYGVEYTFDGKKFDSIDRLMNNYLDGFLSYSRQYLPLNESLLYILKSAFPSEENFVFTEEENNDFYFISSKIEFSDKENIIF